MRTTTRKASGGYVFIPPETEAEAGMRRDEAIARLHEIKREMMALADEREDLGEEVDGLNRFIRRVA